MKTVCLEYKIPLLALLFPM